MKKYVILLLTIAFIYVEIKLVVYYKNNSDNNDIKKIDKEIIEYTCFRRKQEVTFASVNYYYNFDVKSGEIINARQEIVFKFKDKESYEKEDIEKTFNKVKPNRIDQDDKELTKKYSWDTLIPLDDDMSIEDYIKKIEQTGYSCENK